MAVLALAAGGAMAGSTIFGASASFLGISAAGWGWTLGAFLGQRLFGPKMPDQKYEGPRLTDKQVMISSYGTAITRLYGTARLSGNMFWSSGLIETVHVEQQEQSSGGKGGGSSSTSSSTTYTYAASFAVALTSNKIKGVRRIWADTKLIYDAGAGNPATLDPSVSGVEDTQVYPGSATQGIDSVIEAYKGVGNTPAYRNTSYIRFQNMQLADFANRIPSITVEAVEEVTDDIRTALIQTPTDADAGPTDTTGHGGFFSRFPSLPGGGLVGTYLTDGEPGDVSMRADPDESGVFYTYVDVTLLDLTDVGVEGHTIVVTTDSATAVVEVISDVTDVDGAASFRISNTVAEVVTITVEDSTASYTFPDNYTVTYELPTTLTGDFAYTPAAYDHIYTATWAGAYTDRGSPSVGAMAVAAVYDQDKIYSWYSSGGYHKISRFDSLSGTFPWPQVSTPWGIINLIDAPDGVNLIGYNSTNWQPHLVSPVDGSVISSFSTDYPDLTYYELVARVGDVVVWAAVSYPPTYFGFAFQDLNTGTTTFYDTTEAWVSGSYCTDGTYIYCSYFYASGIRVSKFDMTGAFISHTDMTGTLGTTGGYLDSITDGTYIIMSGRISSFFYRINLGAGTFTDYTSTLPSNFSTYGQPALMNKTF